MTSRERVLAAIAHKRTDRAPADYSGHRPVTERLMERLGIKDDEAFLQALGIDMRRVSFDYSQPSGAPDAEGFRQDMWGAKVRTRKGYEGFPELISPFGEDSTVDDVHAHAWPDPSKLDYSGIRPQCAKYHDEYATFGAPWSPFFHEVGWLIGQEPFFIWLHTKPEVLQAIIDHIVDYEVEALRRFLAAAEGLLDIVYIGNDFGTQRSLFIAPEQWVQFMRKPLKRFYDMAHDHGCKVMQHSCGCVRPVIPFLIEDGVDVLDPVQVAAEGMDLASLVRDFGPRLAFHGGVDTQRTLPFGSEADVRAEVRSYLNLTREKGGYILAGSQEYMMDIPPENLLAIYDENKGLKRRK